LKVGGSNAIALQGWEQRPYAEIFGRTFLHHTRPFRFRPDFTGLVVSVIDGDTLEILHNRRPERVRPGGINCPGKGQPYGHQAKQATSAMVLGKEVLLQTHGRDRFGRTLADVRLSDGTHVNHTLITVSAAFAKAGETRSVSLDSRARGVLVRLKEMSWSEYVFSKRSGAPYKSMGKLFTRTCEDAGLAGTRLSLHSLRHTFASKLVMSGAGLRTIQVLGGWHDLSLVQRYGHLSPGHCTQAIERIAGGFHNRIHNSPLSGEVVHLAERLVSV